MRPKKFDYYLLFLNIFLLSVLGGLAYLIWALGAGLPWYMRLAFVFGLFGLGGLLSWACAHGFGAQVVVIMEPGGRYPKKHE